MSKAVEYITAMRIEIERKKLVAANADPVRISELACLMTLCQMENAHKFLAFKNAFTLLYKMQNFITAAHFARQIVALESSGVSSSNLNLCRSSNQSPILCLNTKSTIKHANRKALTLTSWSLIPMTVCLCGKSCLTCVAANWPSLKTTAVSPPSSVLLISRPTPRPSTTSKFAKLVSFAAWAWIPWDLTFLWRAASLPDRASTTHWVWYERFEGKI